MVRRNLHILGEDVQVSVRMGQSDNKGTITVVLFFDSRQMITLWEGLTWGDGDPIRKGYSAVLYDGIVHLVYREDDDFSIPLHAIEYQEAEFNMQADIAQAIRDFSEVRERLRLQPFLTMKLHLRVWDNHDSSLNEAGSLTIQTADGVTFHLAASHGIGYRMEVDSDGDTIFEFYENAYAQDKVLKVIEDDDDEE